MSFELIYTSAPKGLRSASSGFSTVAATAGISKLAMMKLEGLSAYEFCFNLSDPNANLNPSNFAHTTIQVGAERHSVLSRVGFAGPDYSGRANKIAHHFLLSSHDLLTVGPAEMMVQMNDGIFCHEWRDQPKELPARSLAGTLSPGQTSGGPASHWQQVTGDAGWAGMLAKAFQDNAKLPAYVVFTPGLDVLPLFVEGLAILPPAQRWRVSFSTYYTSMPAGCFYNWRAVLAGSTAAREMARFPNATVIDLTTQLAHAPANRYTLAARTGESLTEPPVAQEASVWPGVGDIADPEEPDDIYKRAGIEERYRVRQPSRETAPGHLQESEDRLMARRRRRRSVALLCFSALMAVLLIAGVIVTAIYMSQPRETDPDHSSLAATGSRPPASAPSTIGPTTAPTSRPNATTDQPKTQPVGGRGEPRTDTGHAGLEKARKACENAERHLTKAMSGTEKIASARDRMKDSDMLLWDAMKAVKEDAKDAKAAADQAKCLTVEVREIVGDVTKLFKDSKVTDRGLREDIDGILTAATTIDKGADNAKKKVDDLVAHVDEAVIGRLRMKWKEGRVEFLGQIRRKGKVVFTEARTKGKELVFKVPGALSFVPAPKAVSEHVELELRNDEVASLSVQYRKPTRDSDRMHVADCSLDTSKGVMTIQQSKSWDRCQEPLRFLVIEVVGVSEGKLVLYKCTVTNVLEEGELRLGFRPEKGDSLAMLKDARGMFTYPWHKATFLRKNSVFVTKAKDATPSFLGHNPNRLYSIGGGGRSVTVKTAKFRLTCSVRGKGKGELRLWLEKPDLSEIRNEISEINWEEWEKLVHRQLMARTELAKLKGKNPKDSKAKQRIKQRTTQLLEKEMPRIVKDISAFQEKNRQKWADVARRCDEMRDACEKLKSIEVVDAWGRMAVRFKVVFVPTKKGRDLVEEIGRHLVSHRGIRGGGS